MKDNPAAGIAAVVGDTAVVGTVPGEGIVLEMDIVLAD